MTTTRQPAARSAGRPRPPLRLERLDDRVMPSATPLHLAVIGDSLSAPYPPPSLTGPPSYGSAGDLAWVQQLQNLDGKKVVLHDEAFPGATSHSLLAGEAGHAAQVPAVAALIAGHQVDAVALLIGANDVEQDLPLLFGRHPESFAPTFVSTVVANVEAAAAALEAAGHVDLVIGNVPDVTVTPGFLSAIPPYARPAVVPVVEQAIRLANERIEAFAAAREIPVVDMYGLTHILNTPVTLGGVTIDNLYSPDYFHPNTVGQAILADTVLGALHAGYDLDVRHLLLSDQQVLDEVQAAHRPGRSYFAVSPFVIPNEEAHGDDGDVVRILEGIEHRHGRAGT